MKKFYIIASLCLSMYAIAQDDIDTKKDRINQIEKQVKDNEKRLNSNITNINRAKRTEADIKREVDDLNELIEKRQKEYDDLQKKYIYLLRAIGKNEQQIRASLEDIKNSTYDIITNKGSYEEIISLWDKLQKAQNVNKNISKVSNVKGTRLLHDTKIILSRQAIYIKNLEKHKKTVENIKENTEIAKKNNQKQAYIIGKTKSDISAKKKELDLAIFEKNKAVAKLQLLQNKLNRENIRIEATNRNLIAEKRRLEAQILAIINNALKQKEDDKIEKTKIINADTEKTDAEKLASIEALTKESQGTGTLVLPMLGEVVVKYGEQKLEGLKSNGIEIKGKIGQEVKAADSGTVIYTGTLNGLGSVIIIDHGSLVTVYGNLASIRVAKRTKVTKGQIIGTLGRESITKEPRLYFETRKGVIIVNPLGLL